jgi:tRNA A-37 threonylcarbamoyl transferase component Bud32
MPLGILFMIRFLKKNNKKKIKKIKNKTFRSSQRIRNQKQKRKTKREIRKIGEFSRSTANCPLILRSEARSRILTTKRVLQELFLAKSTANRRRNEVSFFQIVDFKL